MRPVRASGPTMATSARPCDLSLSLLNAPAPEASSPVTRAQITQQTQRMLEALLTQRLLDNNNQPHSNASKRMHVPKPTSFVTPMSGGSSQPTATVWSPAIVESDADCSDCSASSHDHNEQCSRQKRKFFRRTRERLSIVLRRSGLRRQSDGATLHTNRSSDTPTTLLRHASDSSNKHNRIMHPSNQTDKQKKKPPKKHRKKKKKSEPVSRRPSSLRDNLSRFVQRLTDSPVTGFCVQRERRPSHPYDQCELDQQPSALGGVAETEDIPSLMHNKEGPANALNELSATHEQQVYIELADRLLHIAEEFMDRKEIQEKVRALEECAAGTSAPDHNGNGRLPDSIAFVLQQQIEGAAPTDQPLTQLAMAFYYAHSALARASEQASTATNNVLSSCVQFIVDRFSDWLIDRGGYMSAIEGSDINQSPLPSDLD